MDFLLNPIGWLIIGALFMLSELIIPGGIVFFLGAACVIVGDMIPERLAQARSFGCETVRECVSE